MARIRTIKPEFWTSPQIVALCMLARLLFLGLLTFCDDNGVHPASVRRLRMEVFPEDDIGDDEVHKLIDKLMSGGLVASYSVGDELFWLVTGWAKHQKIDRPTFRHPLPDGTRGGRMDDDVRRRICEESASALVETSRRDNSSRVLRYGMESNGVESITPPSQDGAVILGEVDGGAPKIPRRRFVAMAVGARGE